jgi:hypothetical protein
VFVHFVSLVVVNPTSLDIIKTADKAYRFFFLKKKKTNDGFIEGSSVRRIFYMI